MHISGFAEGDCLIQTTWNSLLRIEERPFLGFLFLGGSLRKSNASEQFEAMGSQGTALHFRMEFPLIYTVAMLNYQRINNGRCSIARLKSIHISFRSHLPLNHH